MLSLKAYGENLELLGEGSNGAVYNYSDRYAVKEANLYHWEIGISSATLREDIALVYLVHPNVVTVVDIPNPNQQVLSLASGTLSNEKPMLDELPCCGISACSGLAYIHMLDMAHRDIKTQNILVERCDDLLLVKYADFGGLKLGICDDVQPETSTVTTVWYRAPEALLGGKQLKNLIFGHWEF